LREQSNFKRAANSTYEVAGTLYGKSSQEQNAVKKAWDQVGIKIKAVK
jgi:Zn-dependent metalloprotease